MTLTSRQAALVIFGGIPCGTALLDARILSLCKTPACHNPSHLSYKPRFSTNPKEYFWSQVDKGETHWIWKGRIIQGIPSLGNSSHMKGKKLAPDFYCFAYSLQTLDIIPKGYIPLPHCGEILCSRKEHMSLYQEYDWKLQFASYRFWPRVQKGAPDQCWPYMARRGIEGYGQFTSELIRSKQAHRLAYTTVKGPIPKGQLIRHTCNNPPCCNPNHLVPGTYKDNAQDRIKTGNFIPPSSQEKYISFQTQNIIRRRYRNFVLALSREFNTQQKTIMSALRLQ